MNAQYLPTIKQTTVFILLIYVAKCVLYAWYWVLFQLIGFECDYGLNYLHTNDDNGSEICSVVLFY